MRKFAAAAFSFCAAVFLSEYFLTLKYSLCFAAGFALLTPVGFAFKGKKRLAVFILGISAAAGFCYSALYGFVFVMPNEVYRQTETDAEFTASDFPQVTDYGARVEAVFENHKGQRVSARVYLYEKVPEIRPGDVISGRFSFDLADEMFGEKTDMMLAKGIKLFAYQEGDISVKNPDGVSPLLYPRYIAHSLKEKIGEVFPDDVSPFITAIITGDSSLLNENEQVSDNLKISGIYHVAAVSGMHVAFIVGICLIFTKNRRRGAAVIFPALIIYMAVAGFRPSVVRATVMQIILVSSFLFERENDSITSLSAALLVLLLANPTACKDVGLQLSFAATLGIITVTPRIYKTFAGIFEKEKPGKRTKRVLASVFASASASVGATVFTLPLTAYYFGYVSLVAVITNILIFWALSLAFGLSFAVCGAAYIFLPLGRIMAVLVSILVRYILLAAEIMSGFAFSAVYISNPLIFVWLLILYAAFIFLALKKAAPRAYIIPGSALSILLCLIFIISPEIFKSGGLKLTVLDVGQGLSAIITCGDYTAVVDCGSSSGEDAGETAAGYLLGYGINSVDLVVLTHYHEDHANGMAKLMDRVQVRAVAMPEPMPSDLDVFEEIEAAADANGTKLIYVTENVDIALGDARLSVFAPLGAYSENERGLSLLCSKGSYDILITGDMQAETEAVLLYSTAIADIETLVVGHHGSKYSTSDELLDTTKPETAVISVGYNSYGHPTEEVLERLRDRNIQVFRTDISGNVTIDAG